MNIAAFILTHNFNKRTFPDGFFDSCFHLKNRRRTVETMTSSASEQCHKFSSSTLENCVTLVYMSDKTKFGPLLVFRFLIFQPDWWFLDYGKTKYAIMSWCFNNFFNRHRCLPSSPPPLPSSYITWIPNFRNKCHKNERKITSLTKYNNFWHPVCELHLAVCYTCVG